MVASGPSLFLPLAAVLVSISCVAAQVSTPLLPDDSTLNGKAPHAKSNKYIARPKVTSPEVKFATDATGTTGEAGAGKGENAAARMRKRMGGSGWIMLCPHGVDLLWHRQLKASIYSTPIVEDLGADGSTEVIASTYVRYIEAVEALDGGKAPGEWPLMFERSGFHSSPIAYDVDGDGKRDVIIVTTMGEIVMIRHDGVPFGHSVRIPPLPVKRNWYGGIEEDHTKGDSAGEAGGSGAVHGFHTNKPGKAAGEAAAPHSSTSSSTAPSTPQSGGARRLLSTDGAEGHAEYTTQGFLPDGAQETWELFSHDVVDPPNLRDSDPAQQATYPRGTDTSREHGKVYVPPHVITTPVIADLDGDGSDELIVAVTYYFGKDDPMSPEDQKHNERDTDLSKYVAGGVIAYDLGTMEIKWTIHLDLTTDVGQYRAYIFSAPNVMDLDADGKLEVVLGTSLGFVYVIDHRGKVKPGFPVAVGEIEGHIAVEDLDDDGKLELIVVDFNSNVIVLNTDGSEKWERRISGFAVHGATIGDVDGDGKLDVVIASHEGHVWALRGHDGSVLPHFPVKSSGKIYTPVLLTHLYDPEIKPRTKGMQLVFTSFDGFLYIMDAATGCVEKIDIGEHSYSMVLAADLTGNGRMDLLVSTMNGNLYAFSTRTPHHPLNTWTSQNQGRNVHTARLGRMGIHFADHTPREILGASATLTFTITDTRAKVDTGTTRYDVSVSLGGKRVLWDTTYTVPGTYIVTVDCPSQQVAGTLMVEMTNEVGQYFSDSVHVAFNLHFYRIVKWIVFVPVAVMSAAILLVKSQATPLPTTI